MNIYHRNRTYCLYKPLLKPIFHNSFGKICLRKRGEKLFTCKLILSKYPLYMGEDTTQKSILNIKTMKGTKENQEKDIWDLCIIMISNWNKGWTCKGGLQGYNPMNRQNRRTRAHWTKTLNPTTFWMQWIKRNNERYPKRTINAILCSF